MPHPITRGRTKSALRAAEARGVLLPRALPISLSVTSRFLAQKWRVTPVFERVFSAAVSSVRVPRSSFARYPQQRIAPCSRAEARWKRPTTGCAPALCFGRRIHRCSPRCERLASCSMYETALRALDELPGQIARAEHAFAAMPGLCAMTASAPDVIGTTRKPLPTEAMSGERTMRMRALSSAPAAVRMRLHRKRRREGTRYVRIPLASFEIEGLIRLKVLQARQISSCVLV
jgi:hypothetical protein